MLNQCLLWNDYEGAGEPSLNLRELPRHPILLLPGGHNPDLSDEGPPELGEVGALWA